MKNSIIAMLIVLAAACSPVTVSYDYDKGADFSKYATYNFDPNVESLGIQQLDRNRIKEAIDTEMTKRGYTKSDNPDLLVGIDVKLTQQESATVTRTGGYYGYGWGPGGTGYVDINKYVDGTLFINVIDKAKNSIIWQGRGTKTLNENVGPEKREANIKSAVASIYQKYPKPASK
jgi:hypothetical protein